MHESAWVEWPSLASQPTGLWPVYETTIVEVLLMGAEDMMLKV